MTASGKSEDRQIRVFISSTFRDMKADRDYLVKFTFPQLRRLSESRGVTWGEVDLRWGVTDEQAADGKVLPICLEEIQRCRPYFIGMLGERYGWIPDSIPQELLEREVWLKEQLAGHKSVTELEILHGVLRNKEMAGHAFFYFRDPAYAKLIPETDRADFTAESAKDADKLRELKEKIRQSKFPVRENYAGPEALGALILADLTAVIDHLYPEGSQPSELERERLDHDAYARSRAQVYIGRDEYFQQLDNYVFGDASNSSPSPPSEGGEGRGEVGVVVEGIKPFVIVGEAGSGKSALLANWALRYRQAHPDALVIQHYIGASPQSAEWTAMLRRIMGEFKERLGVEAEIPGDPQKLRDEFPVWLHRAAAALTRPAGHPLPSDGRGAGGEGYSHIILILDALNQLADADGATDLVWLPPVMPENVRLLVSTLPGRPLDETRRRHWPEMSVQPLNVNERKKLIEKYLGDRSKKLDGDRLQKIAAAPPSANPLYLRVLLDELCVTGEHEKLDAKIDHYLSAPSPAELYEKVIARWEDDYEGDTDLVGDALSLLWASRRGLSEAELLEALGKVNEQGEREPLPRARWSPLFLAMSNALVSRSGLLNFAHDFLHTATRETYLPDEEHQQQVHRRLADYFEPQVASPRRTDELPWQLADAKAWPRLCDLLTDRVFFTAAWKCNRDYVKTCWARLEQSSNFRLVQAYREPIEQSEHEPDKNHLWDLRLLLNEMGHPKEALKLSEALVEFYRESGDLNQLQASLGQQALVLQQQGHYEQALQLYQDQEQICRKLGKMDGVIVSLGNQGNVLKSRGNFDRAAKLFKKHEDLCRQSGNNYQSIKISLNGRADIFLSRGELNNALTSFQEVERICRESGDVSGVESALSEQAEIFRKQGNSEKALKLFRDSERIGRALGNRRSIARAVMGQGMTLAAKGDFDTAQKLHEEAERMCREVGDLDLLSVSLIPHAMVLIGKGDTDCANVIFEELEQICRKLGNLERLQSAISVKAAILLSKGDLDGSLQLNEELEQMSRRSGNEVNLNSAIGNQAGIYLQRGDLEQSMTLLKQQEEICRRLGDLGSLSDVLAVETYIYQARSQLENAMPLIAEQEQICRQLSKLDRLQSTLNAKAQILQNQGSPDGAMMAHKERQQICEEINDVEGVIRSLADQAWLSSQTDQLANGLSLATEAHQLATNHGHLAFAEKLETLINKLQSRLGSRGNSSTSSTLPSRETSVHELRDSAANTLKRGLWEAAETHLEKLLQYGEPVETVAPDLITALLNAHETIMPQTGTRIESLLAQLESAGHAALAAQLRQQHAAKLAPAQKKPRWRFW